MTVLDRIDSALAKFEAVAIGSLLIVMSAVAFLQVITRYCFFYSLVWSEELTRYCMIWMTFLGASLAVSKQEHINIDILSDYMKRRNLDIRVILNAMVLIFLAGCIFYSLNLVISTYENDQMTPAIGFPMFTVYLVVLVALCLAAFHALVRVLDVLIKGGRK